MFYVYVLQNEHKNLYVGSTNDLKRRLAEHNNGRSFSTKGYCWKLVYYEAFAGEKDARQREQKLKQHGYSLRHLKSRLKQSLGQI